MCPVTAIPRAGLQRAAYRWMQSRAGSTWLAVQTSIHPRSVCQCSSLRYSLYAVSHSAHELSLFIYSFYCTVMMRSKELKISRCVPLILLLSMILSLCISPTYVKLNKMLTNCGTDRPVRSVTGRRSRCKTGGDSCQRCNHRAIQ